MTDEMSPKPKRTRRKIKPEIRLYRKIQKAMDGDTAVALKGVLKALIGLSKAKGTVVAIHTLVGCTTGNHAPHVDLLTKYDSRLILTTRTRKAIANLQRSKQWPTVMEVLKKSLG